MLPVYRQVVNDNNQPVTATRPHSPPTPLHRQIKVLHEALARFFFHAFKFK
jgi:hypothetical protein